ncbi:MAG: hypothetical protein IPJ47_15055 [Anaerolineales bacterium]|nr:hypothetical protein [Anaerolineales bacterium]
MINAELYGHAQELAVLEERQRLARDLHDAVNQSLFGRADRRSTTTFMGPRSG